MAPPPFPFLLNFFSRVFGQGKTSKSGPHPRNLKPQPLNPDPKPHPQDPNPKSRAQNRKPENSIPIFAENPLKSKHKSQKHGRHQNIAQPAENMQKKHDRTKQTTQSEAGLQEIANTPENNVKTDTKHTDPEENLKSKSQKHIFLEKS